MSMLTTKLELTFIQTEQANLPKFYSTSIRKSAVMLMFCYLFISFMVSSGSQFFHSLAVSL